MGRWRAIGARSKGAHVRTLLARAELAPATIAEIGCGDGSLLVELGRIATVDGFELSANAAGYARDRRVARRVEAFDGENVPAAGDAYDLAVLSHVLEHVPDPLPLLKEAARVARHVIVEVPLEDNRSARRPAKRKLAEAAGHLHAFDRTAVRRLVKEAGLEPAEELTDPLSYEHLSFFGGPTKGAAKYVVRTAAHELGLAERLFTVHYAVLATRA
jgi:SAM-dependent methyltransferase